MARSIAEIKDGICAEFMRNESAAAIYKFKVGSDFKTTFSKVSLESILFYVTAACAWSIEVLFDKFKADVDTRLDETIAHRPKWYRDKVLDFMVNKTLVAEKDYYDTSAMSESDIAAAKVVKHAVAIEDPDSSLLIIKVSGEKDGQRSPLPKEVENQLLAYINEIKDAGVKVRLVNMAPDEFNLKVEIYYDPMLLASHVVEDCQLAVKKYIENLPFNGVYTNMKLVDVLQEVKGVKVVELKAASSRKEETTDAEEINAMTVPAAGYFVLKNNTFNAIAYEQ